MEEVYEGLFVGAENSCRTTKRNSDWAVIHACKHPCHQNKVGQVGSNHPNYLVLEEDNDLYLNMVDMDQKQKHQFMEPMIDAALNFVDKHIESNRFFSTATKANHDHPLWQCSTSPNAPTKSPMKAIFLQGENPAVHGGRESDMSITHPQLIYHRIFNRNQ